MKFITVFIATFILSHSLAGTIYSYYLSEVLSEDLEGHYFALVKDISQKSNLKMKVFPFRRSFRDFEKSKDSCIFPIDIMAFGDRKSNYLYSNSITESPVYFYKLENETISSDENDIKVAINESLYRYMKDAISKKLHVHVVGSDEQLIEMLSRKRVNLVVAIDPDFMLTYQKSKYFNKHKMKLEKHGKKLVEVRDMVVCKKSDSNLKTIEEFNTFITDGYL